MPRKYPKNRKTPYRHTVGSYTRQGKQIASYNRGEGPPTKSRKSRVVGKVGEETKTVILEYPDEVKDVTVKAVSQVDALKKAIELVGGREPLLVEIIG